MIASVSSAAPVSRGVRTANCARSIASARDGRVRICQPPAISTSSTPCCPKSSSSLSSSSAVRTSASVASASSVASSSTVSGRGALNSAASISWERGFTADHHGGKGGVLGNAQQAASREFEQGEQGGQHVHDRGLGRRAPRGSEISGASRSSASMRSVAPSTLSGRATTRCSTGVGMAVHDPVDCLQQVHQARVRGAAAAAPAAPAGRRARTAARGGRPAAAARARSP